jgi:hypothetical protein
MTIYFSTQVKSKPHGHVALSAFILEAGVVTNSHLVEQQINLSKDNSTHRVDN